MIKNFVIAGLAVLVVVFGFMAYQPANLGASPGPDHSNLQRFLAGFATNSVGSLKGVLWSSATTSTTHTAANICNYSIINRTSKDLTSTTTLPTAAELRDACMHNVGDSRTVYFRNNGVTTSTEYFVAGASSTLQVASSTGYYYITGGNSAYVRFELISASEASSTMMEVNVFEPLR